MDKTMMIRWGGRAAGAVAAWKLLKGKVPGGMWGQLALVVAGWLAGGLAADAAAKKVGP